MIWYTNDISHLVDCYGKCRWIYHALILSKSKRRVDSSNLIQVPLLYPQTFFFLQLFCVEICWICWFLHHFKKRLGVSTTEITAVSLNTLRRQVCVISPRGFAVRDFDPVDLRFQTQTFDTTRFNSFEGWPERPERPSQSWRTCTLHMPNKGGVMFFSQLPKKKWKKMLGILIWHHWILVVKMWML